MPDYTKDSSFNSSASVAKVRFGADAPLLETELNELQDVMNQLRAELVRQAIPSGFYQLSHEVLGLNSAMQYESVASGRLQIPAPQHFYSYQNMFAFNPAKINLGGYTLKVGDFSSLGWNRIDLPAPPVDVPREDLVFLEAWFEEEDSTSTIYKDGGEASGTITNFLKDARVGAETSRRVVLKWRIRTQTGVDFSVCPNGFRDGGMDWATATVLPQGAKATPVSYGDGYGKFSSANSVDNIPRSLTNWHDAGLYIAGKYGDSGYKSAFGTYDGLVYALPLFRVYRRPSTGMVQAYEYDKVTPFITKEELALMVNQAQVGHSDDTLKVTVNGDTLLNMALEAGNCEDLSKWNIVTWTKSLDSSVKMFGSNSLKLVATGSANIAKINVPVVANRKYFISAYVKSTGGDSDVTRFACASSGNLGYNVYDTGVTIPANTSSFTRFSAVHTAGSTASSMDVGFIRGGSITALPTVTVDGVMVYDLTAIYGAGNEPSDIPTLEAQLPFVDGMQSSKSIAIKAKGLNVFELINPSVLNMNKGDYVSGNALRIYSNRTNVVGALWYLKLKPNTTYSFIHTFTYGGNASGNYSGIIATTSNSVLARTLTSNTRYTFTTPPDGLVTIELARTGGGDDRAGWMDVTSAILQEGSSITATSDFKASQVIMPSNVINSLKKIPNGVKDSIDLIKKKITKKVGSIVLNGTENWTTVLDYTNVGNNYYNSTSMAFAVDIGRNINSNTVLLCNRFNYSANTIWGSNWTIEGICSGTTDGRIFVRINHTRTGILTDQSETMTTMINKFKAWLSANPITVLYEMPFPVEYDIADSIKGRLYVNPELTTFEVEQMSQAQVNPVGTANGITNGDFSNGVTGWATSTASTQSATGNVQTVTGNGTSSYFYDWAVSSIPCTSGHKIYSRMTITALQACNAISIQAKGSTGGAVNPIAIVNSPTVAQPYVLSGVTTLDSTFTGNWALYSTSAYADATTANGKSINVQNAFSVDLTAMFGAGKEPCQEWCDKYLGFGTNYILSAPTGTIALGASKNGKDAFSGVLANMVVIPANKYQADQLYEIFYREAPETHVVPDVTFVLGAQSLGLTNALAGSMTLATTDVPYKKHPDGARTFYNFNLTVGSTINPGDIKQVVVDPTVYAIMREGDLCEPVSQWGTGVYRVQILSKDGNNTITYKHIGTSAHGSGASVSLFSSLRPDGLFANIVDREDITDLRHAVSLTGFNYDKLLLQEWDRFARGENNNFNL